MDIHIVWIVPWITLFDGTIKEIEDCMNESNKVKGYDEITHPYHYESSSNGVSCIDAIEAATESLKGLNAVYTGNIIKYAWRWSKKGTPKKDIEKIEKYCDMLLDYLSKTEVNEEVMRKLTEAATTGDNCDGFNF